MSIGAAMLSVGAPASADAPAAVSAAEGSGFTALTPARVLDTRSGAAVGTAGKVTVDLAGRVPASATAVVLNVTGTEPTASTFVTAYPTGAARPTASNLNLTPGETRPNLVTVALGAGQKVDLYNHAGAVHLVADLAGYYASDAAAKFTALSPTRVLDTRQGQPGTLGPAATVELDLAGRVPASAKAVVLNLTGTNATAPTYVTAWPTGSLRPTASNLNLTPGTTAPNLVTVAVGANRKVSLYNFAGATDLIADLSGFYTADYGSLFTAMTPKRVLDTRDGTGGISGPMNAGGQQELVLGATLPWSTTGVVLNVTGTEPTQHTYVTAWPRLENRPTASNLNLAPGQTAPNLAVVGVGGLASVSLYNFAGQVHLVADMAGYFSLPQVSCGSDCVHATGSNDYGQLGTGSYSISSGGNDPVQGMGGVTMIAGGTNNGYALRGDGTVWAWGANDSGQLGNGWSGSKSGVPVPVVGLTGVVDIDDGIALKSDGTVWVWSHVTYGGNTPRVVPGLSGVVAVASALGTGYALRGDGTVWAWGSGASGQLGNPAAGDYSATPVQVSGLTDVKQITGALYGALAVKGDGTVWAWGDNRQGQLGNGTVGAPACYGTPAPGDNCSSNVPVQAVGLTGVSSVAADAGHGFAVKTDGTVWGWGSNYRGSLGIGEANGEFKTGTPTQLAGLSNITSVATWQDGAHALGADGRLWAWGDGYRGQLGATENPVTDYHSSSPLRLREPVGVTAIAGGFNAIFTLVA